MTIMNNEFTYEDVLEEQDYYPTEFDDLFVSTDDRVWQSNVRDIKGGDNFADFCEEFFEILDEEEYWEN
jgi:hypothetical protein